MITEQTVANHVNPPSLPPLHLIYKQDLTELVTDLLMNPLTELLYYTVVIRCNTTHNTQHTTHNTQHTTHNTQHVQQVDGAHCTAQHSTAQHCTAQHSTAQHSTAQHSVNNK